MCKPMGRVILGWLELFGERITAQKQSDGTFDLRLPGQLAGAENGGCFT